MPEQPLSEPWRSFLDGVDRQLEGPAELHCFGGFVLAEHYKLARPTADVDVIAVHGSADLRALQRIGGKGSTLAARHRVYLDIVTIATVPDDYEARLLDMCAGQFTHLRLKAFEPHDLALAKLARNADHDREDVKRLAAAFRLDVDVLRSRYQQELRFQFGNVAAADLTLELWIEMITEIQSR